ncbi:MAG: DUF1622 domain-containing protein [Ignavibacteriae bacterium]|nr:DUF1622 domain-containing protein [Ignavibacteriota bacterium]
MHENLEYIKNLFYSGGEVIVLILEMISVICIVLGIIVSVKQMVIRRISKTEKTPLYIKVRMKFGGWLALALEYQLAADIVGTTIAPTYEHVIRLGAIALIRTFLNYFLNKEVKEEVETRKVLIESGLTDDR